MMPSLAPGSQPSIDAKRKGLFLKVSQKEGPKSKADVGPLFLLGSSPAASPFTFGGCRRVSIIGGA